MITATLLLALQVPGQDAGAVEQQPIKDLIEVHIHSPEELRLLQELCMDVCDHHAAHDHEGEEQHAVVYATDAEQEMLTARGFVFEVEIEDLASFYAERAALDMGRNSVGSMGGFRTLAEIYQEMDRLAATYPGIVSPRYSIGQSIQGRDIYAMRISTNPTVHDPSKPVAYYDALHHAREPMSGESLLQFADYLGSNYGVDADITRIIETRNVLLIPCLNPDGYEYNRQTNPNGGGLWRKNRRGNFGVDLNRNYDWEWGSQWGGSSGNQNNETYRGSAPFSEPETQAVRDLLAAETPRMSVSAHTFSDLWIYAWGYTTIITSEDAAFRAWSEEQTAENGWQYGTSWQVLYTANGVADDYHYGEHGTYSFTPEIGNSSDGFWPNPSRIPALTQDAILPYKLVAQWTGSWADVGDLIWTEVSGNGDSFRDPGETWQLQVTVRNFGATTLMGTAQLSSSDPLIQVTGGSVNLNIGQQQTQNTAPFTVTFDQNALTGEIYSLDMSFDYEGYADVTEVDVVLGKPRELFHDDMQTDTGWASNNATNWSWERANPQQTTSSGSTVQPENDNPAGSGTLAWVTGAAAGGGAGTNDVDGTAILTSPLFSAEEFSSVTLEYARWFANLPGNAQDDEMVVEVSNNNGGSWTELERTSNANSWRTVEFRLEDFVALTNAMRLRITVADDPNNDLTEGLIDDVRLTTFSDLPTLGTLGAAEIGQDLNFYLDGTAGDSWSLLYSFQRNSGQTVPGLEGMFYLGNYTVLTSGSLGGDGRAVYTATVPNDPSLQGKTVHLQAVIDYNGPQGALTNAISLPIN